MMLIKVKPRKFGSFEEYTAMLGRRLKAEGLPAVFVFEENLPPGIVHRFADVSVVPLSRADGALRFYRGLYRLLKANRPAIVHVNFYPLYSLLTAFLFACGVRHIVFTDHISGTFRKRTGIDLALAWVRNRFIVAVTRKILCVSQYVLERDTTIPGMDPRKLVRVYNGINTDRFRPSTDRAALRHDLDIAGDAFVIVTAVHLIKDKGLEYLIAAATALSPTHRDTLFLVVGDGPERPILEESVRLAGLDGQVRFLGLRDDVDRLLQASDVFVLPSVWQEAFGLAIIEAMACGLPTIATRVGGIPEIVVHDVTGLLVEPRDAAAIARAVDQLHGNAPMRHRMGEQARDRVIRHFTVERMIEQTVATYREIP